jgi:hypothetical protein
MGTLLAALGGALMKAVFPALATALTAAVMAVLKRQFERLGLELSSQQEQRVKQIVLDVVLRVEELARRNDLTGQQKADIAQTELRAALPELSEEAIAKMIDTTLPVVRSRGIATNAGKMIQLPPGVQMMRAQ